MEKITILSVFVLLGLICLAQNKASKLWEYQPAPGQHINIENIGTPEAAQKMTENFSSQVSLGSFGGFIVLGFGKACMNHPDNPYGIDFTIFGNAFPGSSEPGVVWVMKDENQNGLPDDTWHEIAGSNHFHSGTVKSYEVTYFKTETRDVFWKGSQGETGWVKANSFNLQEYYPNAALFPGYPQDSVVFAGTKLHTFFESSSPEEIKIVAPAFGYADSRPRKQGIDLYQPDNPYTNDVEGAGGDPIDISWAVDSMGNYIDLDSIHFVKIVSASLANAGWLGEISTDVAWVEAVQPRPGISGKENVLVVFPHFPRILEGDSLLLEACYFEKGRKTEAVISFFSQNYQVLNVNANGRLVAQKAGNAEIHISVNGENEFTTVKVVKPDSMQFLSGLSSVYPGDSVELAVQVFDNEQSKLDVPVQFTSSNSSVGKIIKVDGKLFFMAIQPGETVLTCFIEGFSLEKQVLLKVLASDDKIRVYFTLKTENENLLPFQWIEAGVADLNPLVKNRQADYSGMERPKLFNALVSGLQKADVSFVFRDDDTAGGKLFLYSVENDGLVTYGWGGKTEPAAFARAWIARLNNKQYLNRFDEIDIVNGDTVALYHVSDINNSWSYSRLLSNKDSLAQHDEIEVLLEQTRCEYSDGGIIETGFLHLGNAEIFAGKRYFTGENGISVFTLEIEPPVVISSGNDAVLISKKLTTGIVPVVQKAFRVYPNPVEGELIIRGAGMRVGLSGSSINQGDGFSLNESPIGECTIKIINTSGHTLLKKEISTDLTMLNLSLLSPGIYNLIISHQNKTEIHKIIKK